MFLKRVARMFPQSVQRVDRVFLTRWDLSKGWQKTSLALQCIGDLATLSLHLSVDFYIIFLKCFRFISSGDSPPASRLQFALFGRESLQESRFPAHSWKFWFLFKQDISQFIPGNFYFYSNEWFSTFKKTERKGTHKWDEIEVKPEGGGGEKAGGPAVVVDVCHGVRCVCNLGNNFHFFYIFKYDWITFFSHLLHSFHFTLSPLENRFRFWCIWNLGNHKEMSRFWVGGQIWVLAPCSTRWHWQTLSRCPWSKSAKV